MKVADTRFPMPSLSSTWLPTQLLSRSVSSLPLYQWGSSLDLNHVAKLLIIITAFLSIFFFFSGKFKSLDAQAALNQYLWGGIQAFVFFFNPQDILIGNPGKELLY